MKEVKEDLNKWKAMTCSSTGKLTIEKMSILPKLIHSFNTIPVKIPPRFFANIYEIIQLKTILKKKDGMGKISLSNFSNQDYMVLVDRYA